jgi:AraC-like DNA-binding protein
MLFPGEWHNFSSDINSGWDEYCIGFRGVNIDNRIKNGFFSPQKPVFDVGINEDIVNMYKKAIVVAHKQEAGFQQMLAGIVNYLLGFIYSVDKHTSIKESIYYNDINKAKIFMQENFQTELSAETVAEMLNMSYSKFRKVFKQFTGFAPNQYIMELKIKESKELLTKTQLPVKEIAYAVGFENTDYFCTFFKNKTNYSPGEYRGFTQKMVED